MSGHANFHTIGGFTTLHLPANPPLGGNIDVAGSRKAIASAAAKAQRAFIAINEFTGRQIAESVSATDGVFDWNEKSAAGMAVKAAIDAQSELAYLLREVINEAPGWFDEEITLPQDSAQSRQPVGGN